MQFCKDSEKVPVWLSMKYSMETKQISMKTQADLEDPNTQTECIQVLLPAWFLSDVCSMISAFNCSSSFLFLEKAYNL